MKPGRMLVITASAPPAVGGTPQMIYNALRGFPEGSYALLTSHIGLDDEAIQRGQSLPAKYFFFDTPGSVPAPQGERTFFQRCKSFIRRRNTLRLIFHFLSLFYLPLNIVRRGKRIIADEKIELLLAYADHGPVLISTYLLHKLTRRPFCLHFYDLYYGNNFPWFFSVIARLLEPRLFKSAGSVSAMSEALAEHYQKRYRRRVHVVHNAISFDTAHPPEPPADHPGPYRIVYTGNIYWAQAQAIRNLVRAVNELPDLDVEL
jgi:hypothetical protein